MRSLAFLLRVLRVEDEVVLIVCHYLQINDYSEFDSPVIEHQHLRVSKPHEKQLGEILLV